jgi:hypothetical protein
MSANSLRRLLESLGLKRRARDVTPSPLEYAASYARRNKAEDLEIDLDEAEVGG